MTDTIYWITGPWPGRLAIVPRPRGGDWLEDELRRLRRVGVDVLVSLLELPEAMDLGLELEAAEAEATAITFYHRPIADLGVPVSRLDFVESLAPLLNELSQGRNVAIHCRQSVGRSSLLAASLLVLAGSAPDQAFASVQESRGVPVPETVEQRRFVEWLSVGRE